MYYILLIVVLGNLIPRVSSFQYRKLNGYHAKKLSMSKELVNEATLKRDISLVLGKVLDTAEDAALHFRRGFITASDEFIAPDKYCQYSTFNQTGEGKPRIVVVGSGWSAHSFMKIIEADSFEVLCISPRPYFVFTPMLASTVVGTVEYR